MIKTFILHRKITLFILIVLIGFGLLNYFESPRQETPVIEAPVALITAIYPGAGAEDIEQFVVRVIEEKLNVLEGYDYAYSMSQDNVGVIILRLAYDSDIKKEWQNLRVILQDVQKELPEGCEPLEMRTDLADTAGVMVSITGKNDTVDLKKYSLELIELLSQVEGISQFELVGESKEQVTIKVNTEKMNEINMSYDELVLWIMSQNLELPLGKVSNQGELIEVDINGRIQSIDEIRNIVVSVDPISYKPITLDDISEISLENVESLNIMHNSLESQIAVGYFKKDINVVSAGEEINEIIEAFENKYQNNISLKIILDQPKTVDIAIKSFVMNLLQGIGFVILVVLIGMGIRNAIIVSTVIPSAILITIGLMYVFGIELHQISIAALIVALGMLVDNAIVVSDAIQVRLDSGEDRLLSCVNGVKEVAIPILTSTLTTIAAFLPLLLLNSIAGEYISSLPKIVMISLVVSYLIAISVTPAMAYIFFKTSKESKSKHVIKRLLDYVIHKSMKLKWGMLLIVGSFFALTIFLGLNLGLQFFPYAETDMFYIDLKSDEDINGLVSIVEENLAQNEFVDHYTTSVGNGLPKFYQTMPVSTPSEDIAQIMVVVDINKIKKDKRYDSIVEYTQALQDEIDLLNLNGKVSFKALEQGEPIGAPIVVRLTGDSLEELKDYANTVLPILSSIEGTTNVRSDMLPFENTYQLDLISDRLFASGVTKYTLQNEISIALYGRQAGIFQYENKQLPIVVKSDINTLDELSQMKISSRLSDEKIELDTFYNLEIGMAASVIRKYDEKLSVTLYSDVKYGYSPVKIQDKLSSQLSSTNHDGIKVTYSGEKDKIKENFGDVGVSAIIAIILVYLILLIQFNSFLQPIVILVTIPLSTFGSVVGLTLAKQPLSFTAILGMVSLLGIVVNNAIVLVDYINNERRNGKSVERACFDAVEKRFRPIVLSTVTTVIGLLPLVYSGGALFVPMAISLISGLLVSMVLTLVVIPVLYRLFIGNKSIFLNGTDQGRGINIKIRKT